MSCFGLYPKLSSFLKGNSKTSQSLISGFSNFFYSTNNAYFGDARRKQADMILMHGQDVRGGHQIKARVQWTTFKTDHTLDPCGNKGQLSFYFIFPSLSNLINLVTAFIFKKLQISFEKRKRVFDYMGVHWDVNFFPNLKNGRYLLAWWPPEIRLRPSTTRV